MTTNACLRRINPSRSTCPDGANKTLCTQPIRQRPCLAPPGNPRPRAKLRAPLALLAAFLLLARLGFGQSDSAVRFTVSYQRLTDSSVDLAIKAKIAPGVKLFGLKTAADTNFFPTLTFDLPKTATAPVDPRESGATTETTDKTMGGSVSFAIDTLLWRQRLIIRDTAQTTIKGKLGYAYFKDGAYLSSEYAFKAFVQPAPTSMAPHAPDAAPGIAGRSLLWIFLAAFGGGLLALLTPCVYSMIPITVSFFTKRSRTKAEGRRNAVWYAASIVIIFTGIGFDTTLIFGPAALNNLATNWIANLIFFTLFVAFGLSFPGAFEIAPPGSWSSRSDTKANMGSMGGIFFMALTLVIVSLSCTAPSSATCWSSRPAAATSAC